MSNIDIIRNLYHKYKQKEEVSENWIDFFSSLNEEAENYLKKKSINETLANKNPTNRR